jgi:drug/metabolite transporter (DMT)-like permease
MSTWILYVIIAQAINAGVSLLDKFIVSARTVGHPVRLTFFISVLSSLSVLLFLFSWIPLPFADLSIPSFSNVSSVNLTEILLILAIAISFIGGLITLFKSFARADASDVVPVVSSVNAVVTLILSFYILDSRITENFLWGFMFLVLGTFLVAHFRFDRKRVITTFLSGTFFAIHYVALKVLFDLMHFDDAFFWSRIGISIVALCLLLHPIFSKQEQVEEPSSATTETQKTGYGLVVFNKVLAGIASLLILKAIALGNVAIVQALAGMQFIFLMLFSIFFGHKTTHHIGENVTDSDRVQKVISIAVIVTGFSLLFT